MGGPDFLRASRRSAGTPRSRGESKAKPEKYEFSREIAPIPRPAGRRGHQTGGRASVRGRAGKSFMVQRKPPLSQARERATNGRAGLKVGFRPRLARVESGAGPSCDGRAGKFRVGDEPGRTGGQGERSGHVHTACRERRGDYYRAEGAGR